MEIRKSSPKDIDRLMEIFAHAREYMALNGNPYQWGHNGWPKKEVIENDINKGVSYVVLNENKIVGTFVYKYGEEIDPCYKKIYEGSWKYDGPYGVIHRIAVIEHGLGVLPFVVSWAKEDNRHIRIDTYKDNAIMIHILEKLGFVYRGIIYVEHDLEPRLAYEI